jgi:predicted RecB family nuclease
MTQIFELGRNVRDKLIRDLGANTVKDLAALSADELMERKNEAKANGEADFLGGFGEKSLDKFLRRARLYQQPRLRPEILAPIAFPAVRYELYFDIEDDPLRDLVYLHGIYVREFLPEGRAQEKFLAFVARENSPESEKQAWLEFWTYIRSLPAKSWCLYYYSKHERTVFRHLSEKYPEVATLEEVENLFDPATGQSIDLYFDVIKSKTDWPLYSYSVKSIAQFLGFAWRDVNPSGAASIEWFNEYIKTQDPEKLQRILDYNEDDCKAMLVIKDGLTNIVGQK